MGKLRGSSGAAAEPWKQLFMATSLFITMDIESNGQVESGVRGRLISEDPRPLWGHALKSGIICIGAFLAVDLLYAIPSDLTSYGSYSFNPWLFIALLAIGVIMFLAYSIDETRVRVYAEGIETYRLLLGGRFITWDKFKNQWMDEDMEVRRGMTFEQAIQNMEKIMIVQVSQFDRIVVGPPMTNLEEAWSVISSNVSEVEEIHASDFVDDR